MIVTTEQIEDQLIPRIKKMNQDLGLMTLYNEVGENTDGAMTQKAIKTELDKKAPIDSPALTGTPTAPTPDIDDDSLQVATTEYCAALIRRLVGAAPDTLNTLVELATAINNDPNFRDTIVQALDTKVNKTTTLQVNLASTSSTNLNGASASIGVSGVLPVANGGTGQSSLQATRNAMGLGNTTGVLPVANGGTGQSSLQATRNAMGLGNTTGVLPVANGGTGQSNLANVSVGYATNSNYANSAGSAGKVTGGNVALTGDITGSANFNSAGNVSIAATAVKNNIFASTALASNTDLNYVTDMGFYTAIGSSLRNSPATYRIYLLVFGLGVSRVQVAFRYDGVKMWVRGAPYATTSRDWTAWHEVTFTS